jgi:hypothetical protein
MRKQMEACHRSELTDVTAKVERKQMVMTTLEISAVRQGLASFAIVRTTSCDPWPLQGYHARRLLISSREQKATAASAAGSDQAQSPRYVNSRGGYDAAHEEANEQMENA